MHECLTVTCAVLTVACPTLTIRKAFLSVHPTLCCALCCAVLRCAVLCCAVLHAVRCREAAAQPLCLVQVVQLCCAVRCNNIDVYYI